MRRISAWAAIALVPTAVAGIYGMNFDNMPELHWHAGYPYALLLMAASSLVVWIVARRAGWL
jgi:magnesium transporter